MMARYGPAGTLRQLAALGTLALSLAGCSTLGSMFDQPSVTGPGPASTAAAPATDFDNAMTRGKANFASGKYGIALGQFEQALQAQPNSVRALNAVGATYDQLRNFDLADQYYMRAFRIAPSSPDLLNNIGYSHVMRGDMAGAQSYFALAKSLDPGNQVLEANLRLAKPPQSMVAANPAPPSAPQPPPFDVPPPAPFTAVYRTAAPADTIPLFGETHFVRVAPGVQMLVTRPTPPAATNLARAQPAPPAEVASAGRRPPAPGPSPAPAAVATVAPPPAAPRPAPKPQVVAAAAVASGNPNIILASAQTTALPVGAAWLQQAPKAPAPAPVLANAGPAPAPLAAVSPLAPRVDAPAQTASAGKPAVVLASAQTPLPVGAAWLLPAPSAAPANTRPALPRSTSLSYAAAIGHPGLRFVAGVYLGAASGPAAEPIQSTSSVSVDLGSLY
jgi:hypothetical protein